MESGLVPILLYYAKRDFIYQVQLFINLPPLISQKGLITNKWQQLKVNNNNNNNIVGKSRCIIGNVQEQCWNALNPWERLWTGKPQGWGLKNFQFSGISSKVAMKQVEIACLLSNQTD